jgi:aromatic-L-amino-acid decarboxylase
MGASYRCLAHGKETGEPLVVRHQNAQSGPADRRTLLPQRLLVKQVLLKEHGLDTYRSLVEQNVAQAQYLGEMIAGDRRLELLVPIPLNVVCFRYRGDLEDEAILKNVNQEILIRLQESGVAAPSATIIGERFAIRVANVNHRTRREDFEILVREVSRLGNEISAGH